MIFVFYLRLDFAESPFLEKYIYRACFLIRFMKKFPKRFQLSRG